MKLGMRICFREQGGRYKRYRKAAEAAGGELYPPTDWEACDALLLPGGGDLEPFRYGQVNDGSRALDPVRDEEELALLDHFVKAGKPVFGICRGLQVINVYFGGTLHQQIARHNQICNQDRLHPVRNVYPLLQTLYGERMLVNSAHHQAVDRLGQGLQAAQWAEDGILEALCHETLPIWAVQWHPERFGEVGAHLFRLALFGHISPFSKKIKKVGKKC